MTLSRRQILGSGVAGISGLLAGCASQTDPANPTDSGGNSNTPIKFGFTTSLSGGYAGLGTDYLRGFKIWRDIVNQSGGILGRDVKLVYYDDASSPNKSLTLYNRLVNQDNVDLLFGPYGSPINYSAANATARHQLPMVTGAGSDPGLFERGLDYYYSTLSKTTKYGRAFPKYLGETVEWSKYDMSEPQTAAVIYAEAAYTTDLGKSAIENFKEFGFDVVYEQEHSASLDDYTNIITKIKDADPDILAVYGFPQSEATFAEQARQSNLNVDVHYQNYSSTNAITETLGKQSNYMFHGAWWDPRYEYEMVGKLKSMWRNRHPDVRVGMPSAYGPSAGQCYQAAIEAAGSIKPDDVNAELENLSIETVVGPTEFHKTGWNLNQYKNEAVRQWQSQERVLLAPTEFATGEPWLPTPKWPNRGSAPSQN